MKKIFLIIFFLVIFICISTFFFYIPNTKTQFNPEESITLESNTEKEIKESKISLIMVGDSLIHSSVYQDAAKNANNNGYDFKPMVSLIKEKVQNYDLAYYNQETILGGSELGVSNYPKFNSPFEAGDAMIDAGFNLVSLATNHTMDSGVKAVLNSREYWNSKKDILAVGSYTSFEDKDEIIIHEKNGITYTMLNYTYGTNGIAVPTNEDYLVNVWPSGFKSNPENDTAYQEYKENVRKDIEKVRDKVDVLIVANHWGVEYMHYPNDYQKDAAKFLASLNVDIVIGTHPHVIQPVEWIDNTLVFYSLGNFISAQKQTDNYNKVIGLMSSLDIEKREIDNNINIEIKNVKNELIYTYYNSSWRDFRVIPFSDSSIVECLPNYKQLHEEYKNIVQAYDSSMEVLESI